MQIFVINLGSTAKIYDRINAFKIGYGTRVNWP